MKLKGNINLLHVHASFLEIHAFARVFKTFAIDWAGRECISYSFKAVIEGIDDERY